MTQQTELKVEAENIPAINLVINRCRCEMACTHGPLHEQMADDRFLTLHKWKKTNGYQIIFNRGF